MKCAATEHHCDMQGNGMAEVHTPSMSVPRIKASASKASRLIQASIKKVSLPAEAVEVQGAILWMRPYSAHKAPSGILKLLAALGQGAAP